MPTLPPPPAVKLTPAEAAAIAKRGRKLMRAGRITHCQWAVLDCLLWSCRSPATGAIVVSFLGLQRLAKVSRATVSSAIQALEQLRVLHRIKRRVRCLWHQRRPAEPTGDQRLCAASTPPLRVQQPNCISER